MWTWWLFYTTNKYYWKKIIIINKKWNELVLNIINNWLGIYNF